MRPRWGCCVTGAGADGPSRVSTSESSPPTPIQPLQATAASRAARRPPPSPAARRRARTILICVRGNDGRQPGIRRSTGDDCPLLLLLHPHLLLQSSTTEIKIEPHDPNSLPLLLTWLFFCGLAKQQFFSCGEEDLSFPPPRYWVGWRGLASPSGCWCIIPP